MKKILLTLSAIGIIFLVSCKNETSDANDIKSVLYFNGDIITMEGNTATSTEAVVAKEGKIVFVGSKKEAENKILFTKDVPSGPWINNGNYLVDASKMMLKQSGGNKLWNRIQ